jgi:hypothetical protein
MSCAGLISTASISCGANSLVAGPITASGDINAAGKTISAGTTGTLSTGYIFVKTQIAGGTSGLYCGTVSCDAITSTGTISCGTNGMTCGSLSCGPATCGALTSQTITATGYNVNCKNVFATGAIAVGGYGAASILECWSATPMKVGPSIFWSILSDSRIKEIQYNQKVPGLAEINKLNVRAFKYTPEYLKILPENTIDPCEVQIGLIAQEVEEVFPCCVAKNNTMGVKDLRSLNFGCIQYTLITAIQELTQRVKDLEAKLNMDGDTQEVKRSC